MFQRITKRDCFVQEPIILSTANWRQRLLEEFKLLILYSKPVASNQKATTCTQPTETSDNNHSNEAEVRVRSDSYTDI